MEATAQTSTWKRRFNWWKIAFFVSLLAFEIAREVAVLEAASRPTLMTKASVFTFNGWTVAEGRWRRIDDGGELVPAAVRIECNQDREECTEVSVNVHDNSVWSPDMDTFKAQFAPDAITYENNSPLCVHYAIRIDLRLKKVIGVRERTADKSKQCGAMEERIEMQLGDGWDLNRNSLQGHFVPLFSLLQGVAEAF